MSKFKVGDRVRVKSDPGIYSCGIPESVIAKYALSKHTVTGITGSEFFELDGHAMYIHSGDMDGWAWNANLLEIVGD